VNIILGCVFEYPCVREQFKNKMALEPPKSHRRSLSGLHEYYTDFATSRTPPEPLASNSAHSHAEAGPPISKVLCSLDHSRLLRYTKLIRVFRFGLGLANSKGMAFGSTTARSGDVWIARTRQDLHRSTAFSVRDFSCVLCFFFLSFFFFPHNWSDTWLGWECKHDGTMSETIGVRWSVRTNLPIGLIPRTKKV
jgi:hypothetical protein